MKALWAVCGAMAVALVSSCAIAQATSPVITSPVITSQYDNLRSGATLHETVLTPQNVNAAQFGRLGAFKVDGPVYAQPLYPPGVEVPGKGKHNVLFVATEHDSVYAFDAERPNSEPLWHVSFVDGKRNTYPLTSRDTGCPFIQPEIGITSTPAIDLQSGTLYVLARSKLNPTFGDEQYFQQLHALAITTGVEKFGGPKEISASVTGKGDGAKNGQVSFSPLRENPRAALTLSKGVLYLSWGSSCDLDPYHGWVMAYDPQTLAQKGALNLTPDGGQGGIWASDTGPGADEAGNVYVTTGNGTFDAAGGGRDYGDSVVKIAAGNSGIEIRDYFTPYDQARISEADADLGSSGPTLLPEQPRPHRHLLLQPGKSGQLYVIDRDQMGQFHREGDAIIQRLNMGHGGYGAMAYWNHHVYFAGSDDFLRDYVIEKGKLTLNTYSRMKFDNPGATPSISANGDKNAIVWAVATRRWDGGDRPAVLYAFDANKIDQPIYSSEQNSKRDRGALATRFVIPLVVGGRVYFGTRSEVEVYGLVK
jgi:hypothetical protein